VSTSTLGGHVNTIPDQQAGSGRRRRMHSDEFKADAVAACGKRTLILGSRCRRLVSA